MVKLKEPLASDTREGSEELARYTSCGGERVRIECGVVRRTGMGGRYTKTALTVYGGSEPVREFLDMVDFNYGDLPLIRPKIEELVLAEAGLDEVVAELDQFFGHLGEQRLYEIDEDPRVVELLESQMKNRDPNADQI